MIYRIHQDLNYQTFVVPTAEVIAKLGRANPFHIDTSPRAYSGVWKEPLSIKFDKVDDGMGMALPDIAESDGRLFLNEKAHHALRGILSNDGEFLPVTSNGTPGYIFNPLKTADELEAVDLTKTDQNDFGDLLSLGFLEKKLGEAVIFKTSLDNHTTAFCTSKLKEAIEKGKLSGIYFNEDLGNPLGKNIGIAK